MVNEGAEIVFIIICWEGASVSNVLEFCGSFGRQVNEVVFLQVDMTQNPDECDLCVG